MCLFQLQLRRVPRPFDAVLLAGPALEDCLGGGEEGDAVRLFRREGPAARAYFSLRGEEEAGVCLQLGN